MSTWRLGARLAGERFHVVCDYGENHGNPWASDLVREARRARASEAAMLETLRRTAKWCHAGHGTYPASSCGLCKPLLAAIAAADGKEER